MIPDLSLPNDEAIEILARGIETVDYALARIDIALEAGDIHDAEIQVRNLQFFIYRDVIEPLGLKGNSND